MKKRVLLLCTHNSCRLQMAEGLVNHFLGDRFEAFSAGTEVTRVNPLAARVLLEVGMDISRHRSKTMDEFVGDSFDYVITLCGVRLPGRFVYVEGGRAALRGLRCLIFLAYLFRFKFAYFAVFLTLFNVGRPNVGRY